VEETKRATTTVGLLCSDGVILAAEMRASMGNLVANKEVEKILKIQDHLGITTAGGAGDAQALARVMKAQLALYEIQRGRKIGIEGAATLLGNILQNNKWLPYFVQILMGGYDTKPRLYSLDMSGSIFEEKSTSTGSGSPVAFGVLEDKFKENKPVKDNLIIAVKAIKAAIERDVYCGGKINVAVIDKKGFRKLTEKEINELT